MSHPRIHKEQRKSFERRNLDERRLLVAANGSVPLATTCHAVKTRPDDFYMPATCPPPQLNFDFHPVVKYRPREGFSFPPRRVALSLRATLPSASRLSRLLFNGESNQPKPSWYVRSWKRHSRRRQHTFRFHWREGHVLFIERHKIWDSLVPREVSRVRQRRPASDRIRFDGHSNVQAVYAISIYQFYGVSPIQQPVIVNRKISVRGLRYNKRNKLNPPRSTPWHFVRSKYSRYKIQVMISALTYYLLISFLKPSVYVCVHPCVCGKGKKKGKRGREIQIENQLPQVYRFLLYFKSTLIAGRRNQEFDNYSVSKLLVTLSVLLVFLTFYRVFLFFDRG